MLFNFGLEHEVAFLNAAGEFADFSRTTFAQFDAIVAGLPTYPDDYPQLRIGDAGIKVKRWYIEGFERFVDSENPVDCVPKGIEIRTTIQPTIDDVLTEYRHSFERLVQQAAPAGFTPALVSFNPFHPVFRPDPPLNAYELARRNGSPEKQTAHIPMLTYGPDLSVSTTRFTPAQLIDAARKLTAYSHVIVPFSFSSPFFNGGLWGGLSRRTYERTGLRPAALAFVARRADLIDSSPSLTKPARVPAEAGRIEFKAFDSCADPELYGALFALLKGILLDTTLSARATVPDRVAHQHAATVGFDDPTIASTAANVLNAARYALGRHPDAARLGRLQTMLETRRTPAHDLIDMFKQTGSILQTLRQTDFT